ncbi:hypothetical protein BD779DRAFT_1683895 [Infundibulicybe gibba]|nr:hypothetical protein BD779DRAFT_1683895 [Infundibulicybe gibba]
MSSNIYTIPGCTPAPYPHSSRSAYAAYAAPFPAEETRRLRVQLCNSLNQGQLAHMPAGFPFRYVTNGHGAARLAYDSFDFRDGPATISFEAPQRSRHAQPHDIMYMSWKAYLPVPEPRLHARAAVARPALAAHVRVDPTILSSPYGRTIHNDPRIILRALAISVELGVMVTIQVADACVGQLLRESGKSSRRSEWIFGSIVYLGTHPSGRTEVLYSVADH